MMSIAVKRASCFAVVVPSPTAGHLRRLHNMMNRLIEQQGPVSAFATAIVRENNIVLIHCGFADQQDADVLARQTHARRADISSGWSSHRSFRLSADKEVTLAGLLAPRASGRSEVPAVSGALLNVAPAEQNSSEAPPGPRTYLVLGNTTPRQVMSACVCTWKPPKEYPEVSRGGPPCSGPSSAKVLWQAGHS